MNRIIHIYTDGACNNNGRPNASGGWSAILVSPEGRRLKIAAKLTGNEINNNRAELTAVIEGLSALKCPSKVRVTTDSKYVADGATTWLKAWKRNGWQTANKKPVKNADLWQRLDTLLAIHTVSFDWVRGHSGHPENELADTLAQQACEGKAINYLKRPHHAWPDMIDYLDGGYDAKVVWFGGHQIKAPVEGFRKD